MNTKNNRRALMSKQLLRDSLLELLEVEDIQKISIRTRCENAEVNRSTFYKYYGSQYDLLKDMEDLLVDQILKQYSGMDNSSNTKDRLTNILSCFRSQYRLCRLLINSNVDPDFPLRLFYLPFITDEIEQMLSTSDELEVQYVKDCILYGGYQMTKRWINSGCVESPETIAAIIEKTINKLLKD